MDPVTIGASNEVDPAVIAYLEDGFQKLQSDPNCKSLLKKHLTAEVLQKLKGLKTGTFGSTLKDVIQSGVENPDSGVGVYAPDAEAYTVFADLFDPIIEEYHGGFKRTDRHPPCTLGDPNQFGDVDPEGKYVVSTRIRCGRSVKQFPFNPNMTEEHYKQLEELVSGTLKDMSGELKGTYYPLTGMTKEVQQQLIDDHFLFKEGDRFLQKANACRYWPTGRGIYHNDSKTFLVWVGEEDHMRIISMQKGGCIREVYGRLVNAVNEIEKRMAFSHDERLGFLTFCPTNLGTTIRASVHIKLPKLAAGGQEALQRVADRFQLQVRGSAGEHSEAVGGLYDISNKERMGLTEFDAVSKMNHGIAELIRMEKALEQGVDPEVVSYIEAGYQKLQSDATCHSLLKKHLTKEVVDKLKNMSTLSFGSTLKDVIQSGVENPDSGVGVYAPDAEAYTVFADLFDPIIEEYHGGFKRTDRHPPCTLGDPNQFGDVDPEGKYVVSTRIRCGRSVKQFPFNPNMTEEHYKQLEELVSGTLKDMSGELKGTYYPLTGMTKEVQQQLIDDHFLFKEGDRFLQKANACRYWPTGRGIYHNDSKTFLVWVGEEDHMRIISMQKGGCIREVYGRLVNAVNEIEKRMAFSHDERLGFLTFCPTNLGTTIRASVHIKLPKLAAGGQEALQRVADRFQLQVRGSAGEHSEAVGGLYDISNKERMGLTEFDAVSKMNHGIAELIRMEKALEQGVDPEVVSYIEAGYQKLQSDATCHSLLKKHLTKEVVDKLKNMSTPSFGSTLKDVIQSGVENPDSGVGVYAPDAEAYTVFADLFDPIIEEYHGGFKRTDRHPPCTLGDPNQFGDVDPEGKYVVSTRIRCGRSVKQFPFNPNMTEEHYKQLEELVSGTLKDMSGELKGTYYPLTGMTKEEHYKQLEELVSGTLKDMSGELKGTYYPLTGMTKEVQQQLIDDHFLFKEGDRFLQKANACRYWPTGRGIYHNDSKTFLVWVGEEDHMRIISMQKGGCIREVYGRLVNAVNEIEKRMAFSHDERLGFLTFCPTNLGTTIRASVHIKLPKLAAGGQEALQRVADRFQLQVRGSAGEHSEAVGGLYDISNKERMGLTEFDAVSKMNHGIAELIRMEKALEQGVDPEVVSYIEAGYQKLQSDATCHSLLKKHLTKEVVDKLKNMSTPSFGSTLKDVIQSGVENPDSGVGVYAPDAEAYTVFADLFDPIIEEYHGGFKRTDRHPPCTLGDPNQFGDVDPEGKYVVSTRIRCGRSVKQFPFNPNMTEEHYKQLEELVSGTLKDMSGELKGTYYPLTGMTKEVQQQLIDDHFLFKEGDRFLQKANACRYWPTGRGIYHNDSKTFLVWVGEEDHMRIISMQKGGCIREVYGRLVNAVNEIEKRMAFSHDERLGFLTFCPTNLGTTIRASVHIKLPKLAAGGQEALQRVADRFQLQVRGSAGEHSEAVGGLYDISNKERMGLTEFDAVSKMNHGIAELIRMEKALEQGVDPEVVSYIEAGYQKLQSDATCHSLLKKHLTKEVVDKLKNMSTPSFGSTLKDVIQSGVENPDSGVGVYAPDAEAYTVFADLFDPIIEEYHGGFKRTDRHPPCTLGDPNQFGDVDPEGKYVVSTRIRCGRSVKQFPFNPNMTEEHYKQLEELVSGTLKDMSGELKGTYYPLTGMTKEVQQQLIDDHFLFKEGDRFLQKANACRYWPTGRGIYHNDSKTFLVWVGEEDHMRIISMQKGGCIREVYGRLVNAVNEIEKRMAFSHDERLGFLTFCPTNLGTTIRASVHIKLPKLAAGGQEALQRVADRFQLQVRGSAGEHSEAVGGLYDISNKERMGLTEFDAVSKMNHGIAELIKMEKELE
ncbi:hypothetical protein BOX15_Mlig008485g1 [Macrostomum lignano]|uniref:Arginine kinase n=1 Tax=Macrostomum lignano TaxID=282301 RepID=A0A267F2E8_9PLAT|nr:hypothetical protein BOX15_Mlig008485g1 [Macrostomum lignano]